MTGHLSKGLRAAAFSWVTIVVLFGGCSHPRWTLEDPTGASYEVLYTLVGKQVTIRGKFSLRGVVGPYLLLGNQQAVYLVPKGSFTWGKPYSAMEGKLVAATGTLRFFHSPDTKPADQAMARRYPPDASARPRDYFYFEAETARLQLITH